MILSNFVASQTGEVPTPKESGKKPKLKQTGKTPKPTAIAMMMIGPITFHLLLSLFLMNAFPFLGCSTPGIPLV